eukprot:NP_493062.2 Uncharacterized protein CELE_M01G12.6 [Caenorhabditis elegans]
MCGKFQDLLSSLSENLANDRKCPCTRFDSYKVTINSGGYFAIWDYEIWHTTEEFINRTSTSGEHIWNDNECSLKLICPSGMRGVIWSSNYAEMSFDPDETVAAQCSPTLANTEMTGIPDMQWWINGIQSAQFTPFKFFKSRSTYAILTIIFLACLHTSTPLEDPTLQFLNNCLELWAALQSFIVLSAVLIQLIFLIANLPSLYFCCMDVFLCRKKSTWLFIGILLILRSTFFTTTTVVEIDGKFVTFDFLEVFLYFFNVILMICLLKRWKMNLVEKFPQNITKHMDYTPVNISIFLNCFVSIAFYGLFQLLSFILALITYHPNLETSPLNLYRSILNLYYMPFIWTWAVTISYSNRVQKLLEEYKNGLEIIIPCLLFPIFAGLLVKEMHKATENQRRLTSSKKTIDYNKTTRLVFYNTLFFFISLFPLGVSRTLLLLSSTEFLWPMFIDLESIVLVIFTLNTMSHFVIYMLMSSQYQNTTKELFLCGDSHQVEQKASIE